VSVISFIHRGQSSQVSRDPVGGFKFVT